MWDCGKKGKVSTKGQSNILMYTFLPIINILFPRLTSSFKRVYQVCNIKYFPTFHSSF